MFPRHLRPQKRLIDNYVPFHPVKGRSVYTLHKNKSHDIFAFHLEQSDETSRTSVAIFMEEKDAFFYGKLLENHKTVVGNWPNMSGENPQIDLRINSIMESEGDLDELYINEWKEEEVQDFCIHLDANMLLFYQIDVRPIERHPGLSLTSGHAIDIGVKLIEIEVNADELRRRYQQLFDTDAL